MNSNTTQSIFIVIHFDWYPVVLRCQLYGFAQRRDFSKVLCLAAVLLWPQTIMNDRDERHLFFIQTWAQWKHVIYLSMSVVISLSPKAFISCSRVVFLFSSPPKKISNQHLSAGEMKQNQASITLSLDGFFTAAVECLWAEAGETNSCKTCSTKDIHPHADTVYHQHTYTHKHRFNNLRNQVKLSWSKHTMYISCHLVPYLKYITPPIFR